MTTPAPELSPGTVIDGYTIGAKVRERSGAATYAATDPSGADVHFTAYAEACFASALVRERSLRELRQLQGIDAEQIGRVQDCGKLDEGGIYEVGEVIVGDDVTRSGQLDRATVGATVTAIGNALTAAQKVGVIHRNLGGPVVLGSPQGLKVIGFAVGEPQSSGAFGPIDTIAPEQVTGKVVDQRTLIYNLAALTHQLLTGQALFSGTPEEKLDLHANREAADVDPLLKRALSKDPRMRPMMLKQFVVELGKLAGDTPVAAPTAPKPSTRGWTMFMEAAEADVSGSPSPSPSPAAPAPSAPAPSAPAPAPSAPAPTPSAPAPAPVAAKPSTRGWTMFMEAEEAAPVAATPAPAPSPNPTAAAAPTPAPSPQMPAPAAPEPAGAKPSTRGWTMFMDAEEPAAAAAPAPAPSPAPAPAPSQPAPQPPAAAKPSTRGWTMFMDAQDPAEAAAATPSPGPSAPAPSPAPSAPAPIPSAPAPVPSAPAPAPAPAPLSPSPAVSAPAPAPAGAKPSTRGWTMFMDAEAPASEQPEPAAPQPAPSPEPAAAEPTSVSNAPSTRGWTMFMEAEVPADGPAVAEATPAAPVAEPAQPTAPTEPEHESDGEPSHVGASDSKGWTVFMERQPIPAPEDVPVAAPQPEPSPAGQPAAGRTVMMEQAPSVPAPVPASPPAQPSVSAQPTPAQAPMLAPPTSVAKAEPSNKLPIYVGVGVVVVVIIVLVLKFAL